MFSGAEHKIHVKMIKTVHTIKTNVKVKVAKAT